MEYRRHLDPERLAQYAEHGVPAMDAADLGRHFKRCRACAEAYVRLCLKSTARRGAAPGEIWPAIQARVRRDKSVGGRFLGLRFSLIVAACLTCVLIASAALLWRRGASAATLDMGRYLADLEERDAGPSIENLHLVFREFGPTDPSNAPDTRLRSDVGSYRVIEERTSPPPARIVELAYDSGRDLFVLFVAPRTVSLGFGGYHLEAADVSGMRCQRVQCPRQDVYLLRTATRQYVFVRRHNQFADSEKLFKDVIQGAP